MERISIITHSSMMALLMVPFSSAASAGGLTEPVATIAPTPVVATVTRPASTDWTGFYAGAQLGYGQMDSDDLTEDPDGAVYGLHVGYLYDLGSWVLGGELDFEGTDIEDEAADVEFDSIARLKLRAGYDAGTWLPYVTAGVAQAYTSGSIDDDDTGAFAGLGVEYHFDDSIRLGAEVLQHRFEDYADIDGLDIDATTVVARVSFQF